MTRRDRLRAYVDASADIAAEWGLSDCTEWVAQWIEAETGKPLPRASYSSKREAQRVIAKAGGVVPLWGSVLPFDECGFHEMQPGDVCVVDTMDYGPVGGICVRNGMIAWRQDRGVKIWSPNPNYALACWRVPE